MPVSLAHPERLAGFLALLGLFVFFRFAAWRHRKALRSFVGPTLRRELVPTYVRWFDVVRETLLIAGVAALVVALSGLQVGYETVPVKRRGIDLAVVVDVSSSMVVRDGRDTTTRMDRARRELVDLLRVLRGDRVALIAFAGTAFVQCPLTADYDAIEMFLRYLGPDLIPIPGTAIGSALDTALELLRPTERGSRAILLITDGEDHSGRLEDAAQRARADEVPIYAIGIGDPSGAPIPLEGEAGFRRDPNGQIILSRLDEVALQRVTHATGGTYARATTGDLDLERIYTDGIKRRLDDQEFGEEQSRRWFDRYQWLVGAALIMLFLESIIGRRLRGHVSASARSPFAIVLVSLLAAGAARAADDPYALYEQGRYEKALSTLLDWQAAHPDDLELSYNLGTQLYRLGRYDEAAQAFRRAAKSTDANLRFRSQYAEGNTLFRKGELEAALERYNQAIQTNAADADALHNRDLVTKLLAEKQQQQAQGDQEDDAKDGDENEAGGGDKDNASDGSGGEAQDPRGNPNPGDNPTDARSDKDGTETQAAGPSDQGIEPDPNGQPEPLPGEGSPDDSAASAGAANAPRNEANDGDPEATAGPGGEGDPSGRTNQEPVLTERIWQVLRSLKEGRPAPPNRNRRAPAGGKDW